MNRTSDHTGTRRVLPAVRARHSRNQDLSNVQVTVDNNKQLESGKEFEYDTWELSKRFKASENGSRQNKSPPNSGDELHPMTGSGQSASACTSGQARGSEAAAAAASSTYVCSDASRRGRDTGTRGSDQMRGVEAADWLRQKVVKTTS